MSDKMTIVGKDGKPKYELGPNNSFTDLRKSCQCMEDGRPEQRDGDERICLLCNLHIA